MYNEPISNLYRLNKEKTRLKCYNFTQRQLIKIEKINCTALKYYFEIILSILIVHYMHILFKFI